MDSWFANWGQVGQLPIGVLSFFRRKAASTSVTPSLPSPLLQTPPKDPRALQNLEGKLDRRRIAVGDFWEFSGVKVIVRDLTPVPMKYEPTKTTHAVELEVSGRSFTHGNNVRQDDPLQRRFIVPEARDDGTENMILNITVSSMGVLLVTFVRVTHINVHSKQVELEVGDIRGFFSRTDV